jgi:hypothetical protein
MLLAKIKPQYKSAVIIAPLLFFIFACWYGMLEDGTVCSNDGSMYALTKVMAEEGTFSIGDSAEMEQFIRQGNFIVYSDNTPGNAARYWMLTEGIDVAIHNNSLYSDRSPGVAFLSVPFYYYGLLVQKLHPAQTAAGSQVTSIPRLRDSLWPVLVSSYTAGTKKMEFQASAPSPMYLNQIKHFYQMGFRQEPLPPAPTVSQRERLQQYITAFSSCLLGACAIAMLYLTIRSMGLRVISCIAAALVYGLCTVHAVYATTLFAHAAAGFFVMLAFFLTLRACREQNKKGFFFWFLGLTMGLACICEYTTALLCLGFIFYLLLHDVHGTTSKQQMRTRYGLLLAGAILPLGLLGIYNFICFGSVFTYSHLYQTAFDFNKNIFTAFSAPLVEGLRALLIDTTSKGIFNASPVLLLAAAGFVYFYGRSPKEALMAGILFALIVLILSKKVIPTGGASNDPRYLASSIGLLAMGAGFYLDWLLMRDRAAWLKYAGLALFVILFLLSARNQWMVYLQFMTPLEPQERLASMALAFPGASRLFIVMPLLIAGAFVWYCASRKILSEK